MNGNSDPTTEGQAYIEDFHDDGQKKVIMNNYIEFDPQCNSYSMGKYSLSQNSIQLLEDFDKNCKNQKTCDLKVDYTQMSQSCLAELRRRAVGADASFLYDKMKTQLESGN